jgi:hypothetical protein
MSKGQEILLKNLAKQPQFIVLIIYGNTDEETIINKFEMITSNGNFVEKGKSFDELKVFITKWYNWAEGKTNE